MAGLGFRPSYRAKLTALVLRFDDGAGLFSA
jgi:hypothetical protein